MAASARGLNRQRPHNVLVAAQIALAFVLLVCSGLLIKSYARLAGRDLNFEPNHLLTFEFRLPSERFLHPEGERDGFPYMAVDPSAHDKLQRILQRVRRVRGVESIAGSSNPPVNSLIVPTMSVQLEGADSAAGESAYFLVTPRFFETLKTAIVRGRDLDEDDTSGSKWVAIVNETAARRFWPGQDPIGKRFMLDVIPASRPREVIGVVRNIPTRSRSLNPEPVIYASYLQQPDHYRMPWANLQGQMTFVIRTSGNPMSLAPAVGTAVAEIDADIPASNITPMRQYTDERLRELFAYSAVIAGFACVAALLAAIGIYGALAYWVAQRKREIGIRISLGASPRGVLGMVAGWISAIALGGFVPGIAAALGFARLLESQLWQTIPADPGTFAVACLTLTAAIAVACIDPFRRALAVHPATALRSE
jgi:putative ABC transport system permease protein